MHIRPNIIAFSITTGYHNKFRDINNEIKKVYKDYFSVFGGPHATFFPEFIEEEGIDSVCISEGEKTIVELAENVDKKGNLLKGDIQSLFIKNTNEIIRNIVRPLEMELDELPYPDRELFNSQIQSVSRLDFIASRGCPFNCSYCFNQKYRELFPENGNYCRNKSVSSLLKEISEILMPEF